MEAVEGLREKKRLRSELRRGRVVLGVAVVVDSSKSSNSLQKKKKNANQTIVTREHAQP